MLRNKQSDDFVYLFILLCFLQMDLIVVSPTGLVLSVDLCNVAADLEKKMSITHAEALMNRLVKSKWLSKVRIYWMDIIYVSVEEDP